jgi:hypothetical protein
MKCPHCGYENGWNNKELKIRHGEAEDFFRLSNAITMERKGDYEKQTRTLCGCPVCHKVFID